MMERCGRLSHDAADRAIRDTLRGSDQMRIGAEAEWLVFDASRPSRPVPAAETAEAAGDEELPAGGTVSVEPGGQLELSTQTFAGPEALRAAIEEDARALVRRFARTGLVLVPLGLDPLRPPRPSLDAPRYVAMERHFRQESPEGVRMMASTAALQLSVDPGPTPLRCWRVLSAAAPLLSALFANSGVPGTGSARQRVWAATDPSRTTPVPTLDPQAWVDAVLDATVMLRARGGGVEAAECRRSFRTWLDDDVDPPTAADLAVHLTTMFPPVRPRGHLEVRVIDAVPSPGRAAAVAAVWVLATVERVGAEVIRIADEVPDLWQRSLADGTSDPRVGEAGRWLLEVVATSVEPEAPNLARACRSWAQRQTSVNKSSPGSLLELAERT
ncbi:MAG TPA: ergothioneine biosynthesis glutamate--cysteine ligase EgtA [Acidimicrobiaceae bacterium]|nr:ergothioneine biosynthesis glutamate--cysteine ligase EgtA [Acidimicrobiaceae bacterium]